MFFEKRENRLKRDYVFLIKKYVKVLQKQLCAMQQPSTPLMNDYHTSYLNDSMAEIIDNIPSRGSAEPLAFPLQLSAEQQQEPP